MIYVSLINSNCLLQNMTWRLRILLFYFIISTFTVSFFIIFCLPLMIIKVKYHIKYQLAKFFSHFFVFCTKNICGLDYEVEGLEHLPKVPSVVLANHQSFWDNFIMQIIIPEHSWIIKNQLFKIPFLGWALKLAEPIAVDRTDNISVKQILREGDKKLASGLWLIIFPESTRLRPDQTTKFKPSAVKLASLTKVPIVLMVHNAGLYWPKGFWLRKPGTIKIKILESMYPEQIEKFDVRDLTDHIENIINIEKKKLVTEHI